MSPTYSVCADHGYIAGEVYECPTCGKKTEVYSRITGYYRPVQNWNDGKSQEYKERKTYNIATSKLTHQGPKSQDCACESKAPVLADGVYLFATKTCPNCKIAKQLLDQKGIAYTVMLAEENGELIKALDLKQAPTLMVVANGATVKYVGVPNVKEFIKAQEA